MYDWHVRGYTVLAMPEDAGVIRVDELTGLGMALATDGNGRYCLLDPYAGAQLALAEAYRNVAATGARPVAVTNCLNFGSPEDPGVMWQFTESVRGLADGCAVLGTPVTGGNVSFYNQTGEAAIHPMPSTAWFSQPFPAPSRSPSSSSVSRLPVPIGFSHRCEVDKSPGQLR
jgi:phosphoribosylformylglycinamidine synthase